MISTPFHILLQGVFVSFIPTAVVFFFMEHPTIN